MPKSKVRRKPAYTPPPRKTAVSGPSHPVYIGVMLAMLVLGLAWIVVNYLGGEKIDFMAKLGNYNFLVGFGLVLLGLIMTMRWR